MFFHHSIYHAVFDHAQDRRLSAYWFIRNPDTDARLAALWRNDVTFTVGCRHNVVAWRGGPSPLLEHPNPMVCASAGETGRNRFLAGQLAVRIRLVPRC